MLIDLYGGLLASLNGDDCHENRDESHRNDRENGREEQEFDEGKTLSPKAARSETSRKYTQKSAKILHRFAVTIR